MMYAVEIGCGLGIQRLMRGGGEGIRHRDSKVILSITGLILAVSNGPNTVGVSFL
jgi:hypothetical protein